MIPMLLPPSIQAPASAPKLTETEDAFLQGLDAGAEPKAAPELDAKDRAAFTWLQHASMWKDGHKPMSPFPKGSAADKEAQAWRTFLGGANGNAAKLPLRLSGSRLLLWSWMRDREHHGPLPNAQRTALEDRLLDGGPAVIRGWALRHALCFAVAEKDLARFTALKATQMDMAPDTFTSIQSLFALLDGPSPAFRLWRLPDLAYDDTPLGGLGATRVWICPPGVPVPDGAAWIIPSATGEQSGREADLDPSMKAEARALLPDLHGRAAWFAASKETFESYGLQWFPILIELDGNGNLRSVKMGDAAP